MDQLFCITLNGSLGLDIAASINLVAGGTATITMDFQSFPNIIVLNSPSNPRVCQSFTVFQDAIVEDPENFRLSISSIFSRVTVGVDETEIVIMDATRGSITYLNSTTINITEGNSASLCFENVMELEREITIVIKFGFTGGIEIDVEALGITRE